MSFPSLHKFQQQGESQDQQRRAHFLPIVYESSFRHSKNARVFFHMLDEEVGELPSFEEVLLSFEEQDIKQLVKGLQISPWLVELRLFPVPKEIEE